MTLPSPLEALATPLPSPLDQPIDVVVVDFDKPHCLSCLRDRRLKRQLCSGCYERHRRRGTLGIFGPPPRRAIDDVVTEYDHLRQSRVPVRDMPGRIGMTRAAFAKAMQRARAAGDDRAATFRGMRDGAQW